MVARLAVLLAVLTTACSDSSSPRNGAVNAGAAADSAAAGRGAAGVGGPGALAPGTATSTGMVSGWELNPAVSSWTFEPVSALAGVSNRFVFVRTAVLSEHHEIFISDFDDQCGSTNAPFGRALYIDLFDDAWQPNSLVGRTGTFRIWQPPLDGGQPPTGRIFVANLVEVDPERGGMGVRAQAGMVTVTSVGADHIAGTFDLDFTNDSGNSGVLSGSFKAALCPGEWHRSANVPVPSSTNR